jgi:hypothetical protein
MIGIWGDESLIAQAAMSPDLSITHSSLQPENAISQFDVDELMWTDPGSASDNCLESAAARLEQLNFHTDPEMEISGPDTVDDTAARRNPLDADAEMVLASAEVSDEPEPVSRKALVELSQDMRTILFS